MKTNPYSAYRGRKSWLRRILIAIVILLVIALAAALVGLVVLPNYVVYTPDGPRLVIPFFGGSGTNATPTPAGTPVSPATPGVTADDPGGVVIESAKPSPSPSPTPKPELYPRRDAPLGLTAYELPRLLDGSAKESLARGRGAIFDMTENDGRLLDGVDLADLRAANQALPYSAALINCFGADGAPDFYADDCVDWCLTVAGLGFDEIVLANADYTAYLDAHSPGDMGDITVDEQKVTGFYTDLRAALDDLGYEGRLSVVCAKETFTDNVSEGGQSGQAVANYFERVYVPGGNWGGFNLYKALKDMGFAGTTADIVTVVSKPISANYSWAVLP